MTRKECLDAAAGCVLRDRNNEYGGPEDSFSLISSLWSAYLGVVVDTVDVAMMMGMLKMARIKGNKSYWDGFCDLAGYAACGAECATAQEEIGKALDEHGAKIVKRIVDEQVEGLKKSLFAKAEEPEFRYGDKIQYRVTLPSVSDRIWLDGTYDHILPNGAGHMVRGEFKGDLVAVGKDDVRRRPEAKAEGCEDLVSDAPQTKEELMECIKSVNPAIYGAHLE